MFFVCGHTKKPKVLDSNHRFTIVCSTTAIPESPENLSVQVSLWKDVRGCLYPKKIAKVTLKDRSDIRLLFKLKYKFERSPFLHKFFKILDL